jgi:signal recognition particle subunit SRP14
MAPSMRKRDKKREKAKAETREKKRKEIWTDVEIGEGGKRGKGHRQRVSP